MQKDDALLYDVLESARLAVSYVQDSSIDDFLANTQLQDTVIRRIEIIGEAALGTFQNRPEHYFPTCLGLTWQTCATF